jgi:8-oxo-dGTP diphosphatase
MTLVAGSSPVGHIEGDESVIQCAAREVLEETGLKITALSQVAVTDRVFSVGYKHYITMFVSCEYESGDALVMEPDKCECWQWFDYRKLPQPLFEPIEILLSQQDDLYALKQAG